MIVSADSARLPVSVVVISCNEAPRLRLVLESLAAQDLTPRDGGPSVDLEVVVVDDASTDETRDVLLEARSRLPLQVRRHDQSWGRSPSRNDGVAAARGEVVIFFDGDVLAWARLVALHAATHAGRVGVMGRGETYHLRCTRFFHDPERGTPRPGEEDRVARMGPQLHAALVTREQIRSRFDAVTARGEPGIYAGAGPRRLYELEMQALHAVPGASILWMAASGHNFSVRREEFRAVGGFHPRLTINEHRELAIRLQQRGARMVPVSGARSFHMLHRTGWRDPLVDTDWERTFYEAHPTLATQLMSVFWLSLSGDRDVPEQARILSLEQLEAIVQGGTDVDYSALRCRHPKLLDLAAPPPS
jgi:glycosyltransferase involved in cell wall biosynthesis